MRSLQTYRLLSAASTNATLVRASRGMVHGLVASNTNAAVRYLKLYDKATAPTVGTDSPSMTIALPPGQTISPQIPAGVAFEKGIGLATTAGVADADTAAVAANEIVVNLQYS